uniref:Zinc finger protein ubi-d4 n=1 Tax=Magallana gigas TaxID=29159 RepID=K1PVM8_MAGGI
MAIIYPTDCLQISYPIDCLLITIHPPPVMSHIVHSGGVGYSFVKIEQSNFGEPVLIMGGENLFKDAIEHTANLNMRMGIERKLRLPFLDSQTGVAQSHTSLWHPYRDRQPGLTYGQLYSYPANRWKKRKRLAFMNTESRVNKSNEIETGESDVHQINTVENPAICKEEEGEKYSESSKDRWFEEYDNLSEPPDAGEMVDDQSDISDYEETYIKKKKKKQSSGRGRKKNTEKEAPQVTEEKDKPYSCEACGARYKTKPGLQYHYNHFHNGMIEDETVPSPQPPTRAFSRTAEKSGRLGMDKQDISANNYCGFYLGDSEENKKTNQPEELVSCSDCSRSGVYLRILDQLLFCDDCDRGYHMYCLNPPLSEPPEGKDIHISIIMYRARLKYKQMFYY